MKIHNLTLLLAAVGLLNLTAKAQLSLTGTNYLQTFDKLDSGLPDGWMVSTNAHATNLGTLVVFTTNRTSWSSQTGQFQNSASTSNAGANLLGGENSTLQSGYTNRALAIRQSSSFGDPGAALILSLSNTTRKAGFQLDLDFLMLSLQPRSTVWTVEYATGNNPTNFVPLASYDDPGIFGATHATISFGTALDQRESNVWIRIAALTNSAGSNNRDTFGIDNFSLSWTNLPSANSLCINGITLANENVQIDFACDAGDVVASFTLQSASQIGGTFGDVTATISQTSPGHFRAGCALNGLHQFYRIKRQ